MWQYASAKLTLAPQSCIECGSVALISSTVRNRHMVVMAAHQKELVSEQELELRPTRLEIKNPTTPRYPDNSTLEPVLISKNF